MVGKKKPIQLTRNDVRQLVIVAVAAVILASAFFAPWWTRGYTIDHSGDATASDKANDGIGFIDTFAVSYGPFSTPSFGPFQFDAVREAAVTFTGIAIALGAVFLIAHNAVRIATRLGRIQVDHGLPVKLAIASFWLGLIGVGSAILWPFLGMNVEGIYAAEELFRNTGAAGQTLTLVEESEFLNVGFFLGVLGFIAYPGYLWAHAAAVRREATAGDEALVKTSKATAT